ncbi:MAG: hypothetical protein QXT14_08370 [Candidatus Bathyarchaeia archaeon]
MNTCFKCGKESNREVVLDVHGRLHALTLCDECYKKYEPKVTRKGIEWREIKRFRFSYSVLFIESSKLGELISKASANIDWIASKMSVLGIILSILSTAFMIYGIVDRLVRYNLITIHLLKHRVGLMIPGIDPILPLIEGLIALLLAMIIHEFMHGVVSTYYGIPPSSAGVALFLGFLPFMAYVKHPGLHRDPWKNVKIAGAGIVGNAILALISLALFLLNAPGIYFEKPMLVFAPPPLLKLAGIMEIELPFTASLLYYVWFVNFAVILINGCMLFPAVDGHTILKYMLLKKISYRYSWMVTLSSMIVFTTLVIGIVMRDWFYIYISKL